MAKKNLSFRGFKEAEKILDALPKRLGSKVVQDIIKEGAEPLITQAKTNAPQGPTGNLARSIGTLKGRGAQKGAGMYVGPVRGKGRNQQGWHAHLVEYGTGPRRVKKKQVLKSKAGQFFGTEVGPMPAKPFLRPAWDQTNAVVLQKIGQGFKSVLLSDFKNVKY